MPDDPLYGISSLWYNELTTINLIKIYNTWVALITHPVHSIHIYPNIIV